jgi:hypothetical protein
MRPHWRVLDSEWVQPVHSFKRFDDHIQKSISIKFNILELLGAESVRGHVAGEEEAGARVGGRMFRHDALWPRQRAAPGQAALRLSHRRRPL